MYHRQRDSSGFLYSPLDRRPGTTSRTVPILGRYPRDCWPLLVPLQHLPARGHPLSARLKAFARVIAIILRVLQLQYFSQSTY
jgi:hypothetical protein